jgi:hypothetical protein
VLRAPRVPALTPLAYLLAHILIGKPVSTLPGYALTAGYRSGNHLPVNF